MNLACALGERTLELPAPDACRPARLPTRDPERTQGQQEAWRGLQEVDGPLGQVLCLALAGGAAIWVAQEGVPGSPCREGD